MCVRLFAIWVCGFDHFWGMDFCFACCMLYGRAVGDRPVTGCSVTFVCLVVFCCVGFNRVCNSLCNILQTDTDTFSSKCDTTQEQRLLKISEMWKHLKTKTDATSNAVLHTSGDRFHYGVSYTAPPHSSVVSTFWSTLDMADMFFILSRYLCNLEHLFQM